MHIITNILSATEEWERVEYLWMRGIWVGGYEAVGQSLSEVVSLMLIIEERRD